MSELEPDDSRDVTNSAHRAPGEPPRTGPREDQARAQAQHEQGERRPEADSAERAIEGDSPAHPDRMGAFTGETADGEPGQQEQAQQGDRWKQAAEREDYVPEGK
jgi:hypothetical protein